MRDTLCGTLWIASASGNRNNDHCAALGNTRAAPFNLAMATRPTYALLSRDEYDALASAARAGHVEPALQALARYVKRSEAGRPRSSAPKSGAERARAWRNRQKLTSPNGRPDDKNGDFDSK